MFDEIFKGNIRVLYSTAYKQIWNEKKFSYINRSRPEFGVFILKEGEITFKYGSEKIVIYPNQLIFLPKNCRYEALFGIDKSVVLSYLVNFDLEGVDKIFDFTKPTVLLSENTEILMDYFENITDEYAMNRCSLKYKLLFYTLFDSISVLMENQKSNSDEIVLNIAEKMLRENKTISIATIAQKLYVSQSYLQKNFLKKHGETPATYRKRHRIEKARHLLITTDLPINRISYDLNFYDDAYFNKTFKEYYGCTPKKYRDDNRPKMSL